MGWLGLAGLSFICLAMSTSFAMAQEQPPKQDEKADADSKATPPKGAEDKPEAAPAEKTATEDKPEVAPAEKPEKKAEAATEPEPLIAGETAPGVGTTARQSRAPSGADRVTTSPGLKAGKSRNFQPRPRGTSRSSKKASFKTDPNAKWVCENTVVSVDPVWRGNKKLTFDFQIRNDGTADLRMKAKGG
jgi:hypothetical protein